MFGINPLEVLFVGFVSLGCLGCVVAVFVLLVKASRRQWPSLPPWYATGMKVPVDKQSFKAFATTERNDGPRIPIDAERIVVVLGEDGDARTLEVSIRLRDFGKVPPKLLIYAIVEPTPNPLPGPYRPRLEVTHDGSPNCATLSVQHEPWFKQPDDRA